MSLDAIGDMGASGGRAASDRAGIADDFDAFLQMLTTQLQNQSPLDPMDTNEFTQQLVQFAGVEQSIRSNENLESLIQVSSANAATAAAGFVGKRVTAETARSDLKDGNAEWDLRAEGEAANAEITIRDESGQVVRSEERGLPEGRSRFDWDGKTDGGQDAPDGPYTLSVEAEDSAGEPVDVVVEATVRIDGVDFSDDEPVLMAGDKRVPVSQIRSIHDS